MFSLGHELKVFASIAIATMTTSQAYAGTGCPSLNDESFPQEVAVGSTTCPISDNPSLTWIVKKCTVTATDTTALSGALKSTATSAAQSITSAGTSAAASLGSSEVPIIGGLSSAGAQLTASATSGGATALTGLNGNLKTVTVDGTAHKQNRTQAQSRHRVVAMTQGRCEQATAQLSAAVVGSPTAVAAQTAMAEAMSSCLQAYGMAVAGADCNTVCSNVAANLNIIETEQTNMITKLDAATADGVSKTTQLASCMGIDNSDALADMKSAQSVGDGSYQEAKNLIGWRLSDGSTVSNLSGVSGGADASPIFSSQPNLAAYNSMLEKAGITPVIVPLGP